MFLAIVCFVLLVVLHEYGHFLVAKRNGVKVEEFGIGFPPKISGKKMGKGIFEGYYTLNWLPLGGFVRLFGENDADKRKGSFGAQSLWVKTKIILAGVIVNYLIAVVIFTVLAMTGMPKLLQNQFEMDAGRTAVRDDVIAGAIVENTPAAAGGIQTGDVLLSVNGEKISAKQDVNNLTDKYAGQDVQIQYERDGKEQTLATKLNTERPHFGVAPEQVVVNRYTYTAPVVGIATTAQITGATYAGLADLFGSLFTAKFSQAAENVSGPVGVVVILNNISEFGLAYLIFFMAVISLTLAIMNALPIPALDGGRLFVTYLFRIFKKPLTPKIEERIHGTGFVVLLALIVLISVVDVRRFF